MAVKIRLSRKGRRGTSVYRVVVADKEYPRDGRVIEILGHYDPSSKPKVFKINREKLDKWVEKGAKCSDTIRTLLKKNFG